MGHYFVYILANRPGGTLYVGVTSDLVRRVAQHRKAMPSSFAGRYNVHALVWFEVQESIEAAIRREKRIKKWPRAWKVNVIEVDNPAWHDLYPGILGAAPRPRDGPDKPGHDEF